MKIKEKIIILYFVLLGTILNAQTFSTVSLPAGVENKNLFSVTSFQDCYYIAGDNVLLKSTDFGDTWQIMYQSDTICFYDVEFYNNEVGYAIGMNKQGDDLNRTGHMFKTTDGGQTWICTHTPPEHLASRITTWDNYEFPEWSVRNGSINVLNENRIITSVGSQLYFSSTGGRTYYCGSNIGNSLCSYAQSLDNTFYGNSLGLKKYDTPVYIGLSHETLISNALVFDMDFISENLGFAVMEQQFDGANLIVITGDGATKIPISEVGAINFYGIDFVTSQTGYIVGENGTILKTTNAGNDFQTITSNTTEQLNRIDFINDNVGIIVGNNGTVLKTSSLNLSSYPQKGQNPNIEVSNWYKINSGFYSDLYQIEMETNNYYISGNGVILKSTDKGETWSAVFEDATLNFTNISFVNDNIGWVGATNSDYSAFKIYKTIDAGLNWTFQIEVEINDTEIGLFSPPLLKAKDENTVLAVTASVNVFQNNFNYSLDGGTTWDGYLATSFRDFLFLTNNEVLGVEGQNVSYYVTEDFSTSSSYGYWSGLFNYPGTEGDAYVNGNSLTAINLNDNIYKVFTSKDKHTLTLSPSLKGSVGIASSFQITGYNGENPWSNKDTYIPADMYSIIAKTVDTVYMCGQNGIIVKSTTGATVSDDHDFHKIWFNENSNTLDTLNNISFDGNIGIVVGNNGTILKTTCSEPLYIPEITLNETSNILETGSFDNFQWYYCGNEIANSNIQQITPDIYGSYSVVVTNQNGCKTASIPYLLNSPSTNINYVRKASLSIYPNPTNSIININFSNNNIQKLTISDITGKQLIEQTELPLNKQIDLSDFDSGIYIISIQTDNEIFTTKIIKE